MITATATKKTEAANTPKAADVKREQAEVSLIKIRIPAVNPARVSCDRETIENYKEIIAEYIAEREETKGQGPAPKFPFPVPKVKRIEPGEHGCDFEVIGGCHTLTAASKAGLESIEVEICDGSEQDLLIESIQDNAIHGLQYTREDIRHNVLNLKKVAPRMTSREMALIVGCGKSTVANILKDKPKDGDAESADTKNERATRAFSRKRFVKNILRMVEKNIEKYSDADMIELAKISGRIIKMLEEKRPEMRKHYYESLQAVVDPESMERINYEGETLYCEEKSEGPAA